MEQRRHNAQFAEIRRWYEQIIRGVKPSKADLEAHFRGYADQAEVLVRRIEDGQSWDDFIMGLDGAPVILLSRLKKQAR